MKKSRYIFIILIPVLAALSCSQKIQTVPEVTESLTSQDVYTFNNDVPVLKMLQKDTDFVIVNGRGTISKIAIASGEMKFLFQLNFAIHPDVYSRGDYLVLREQAGTQAVVFDIGEMKILRTLNPGKGTCIGVNATYLAWHNGSRVSIYNVAGDLPPIEIDAGKAEVFDCQSTPNAIYLPTADTLHIIDISKWTARQITLPLPSGSGILVDDGAVYYGAAARYLVKFNPEKNKILWKFRLTKKMTDAPQKIFKHIVCTPEDQNIYFVTPSGTLDWWQKLDSTRLLHPVPMMENIAVFLFPQESPQVKYFNFKERKSYSYKLDYLIQGNPVSVNGELYILKGQKDGQQKKVTGIAKIGNRFEVDVKTDPKLLLSTGKSIKFILTPVNLIDPELDVNILNSKKESIFNKKITDAEKAQFNWIPDAEGDYELSIAATSENGHQMTSTQPFKVMDLDKLLLDHYLNLQQDCNSDVFEAKKKKIDAPDH